MRYRITGTVPPGPGHRLELIGQPLVARTTMTVTVTSTDGRRVVSRSGDDSVSPVGEGGAEVELIKDVHRTIGLTVE